MEGFIAARENNPRQCAAEYPGGDFLRPLGGYGNFAGRDSIGRESTRSLVPAAISERQAGVGRRKEERLGLAPGGRPPNRARTPLPDILVRSFLGGKRDGFQSTLADGNSEPGNSRGTFPELFFGTGSVHEAEA